MRRLRYDVVCFDFWNTLIHETFPGALVEGRLPAIRAGLAAIGVDVADAEIRAAHAVAQARFEEAWAANEQFRTEDAAEVMRLELGLDPSATAVIDVGFAVGGAQAQVTMVAGAVELLEVIRGSGSRTAIVCDIGLTPSPVLIEWLRERQLFDSFDRIAFSDIIGSYKPSPLMFDWVLDELRCHDPSRAVHIGDRRRTDVQAARARGLASIRFRGIFDDRADLEDADHVVDSLPEIAALLRG
jgi:FMN phosphatase YigB (HAD superfamily)